MTVTWLFIVVLLMTPFIPKLTELIMLSGIFRILFLLSNMGIVGSVFMGFTQLAKRGVKHERE